MDTDMLAELAHLFFLEATDWRSNRSDLDRAYLMKCSHALACSAVRGSRRVAQGDDHAESCGTGSND